MRKKKRQDLSPKLRSKIDSGNYGKVFVLDTNVLVSDPEAIEVFRDNIVVIPIWVIEELDHFKTRQDNKGESSRAVSRKLDYYKSKGSLRDGVVTAHQGLVLIDYNGSSFEDLPIGLEKNNDNRIILIAAQWQKRYPDKKITVVSQDTNLRLKADACGIPSEDYENVKAVPRVSDLYTGHCVIELTDEQSIRLFDHQICGRLFDSSINRTDAANILTETQLSELVPNQCCYLKSPGQNAVLVIFNTKSHEFKRVEKPTRTNADSDTEVKPINPEQCFAYEMLMNPDIKIVTLVGKAGTGKTLISLLAGYEQLEGRYKQILVYRPNIELGRPMGYLPGTIEEKFAPWMQPIADNLRLILKERRRGRKATSQEMRNGDFSRIEELIQNGLVTIEPIVYIRGRSLIDCFIIIDETQNLSLHEVRTIITRVGRGSKIVLTGDPSQIDNPYVTAVSNGLSHVVMKFKGQESFGHITLPKSERSELAELAADLL